MNCEEMKFLLDDYVDGSLPARNIVAVEEHIAHCVDCRKHLEYLHGLLARVEHLPKETPPTRDLWHNIEKRLESNTPLLTPVKRRNGSTPQDLGAIPSDTVTRRRNRRRAGFALAATVVIAITGVWFFMQPSGQSWNISRLEGTLTIGDESITDDGTLPVGEWLETDNTSRARIDVGLIGEVEVEPNSRLRVLNTQTTDHRVELQKGTINAHIWAPPRLFFVETPSATAIDLGCVYTLSVDEQGNGLLKVSAGYVALQKGERESIVPAGAACETRAGFGPGTPFRLSSSEVFRNALSQFDFENDKTSSLKTLLESARSDDVVTLWHLLQRTAGSDKQSVLDRLVSLSQMPPGVTRGGILNDNKEMLQRWGEEIGVSL